MIYALYAERKGNESATKEIFGPHDGTGKRKGHSLPKTLYPSSNDHGIHLGAAISHKIKFLDYTLGGDLNFEHSGKYFIFELQRIDVNMPRPQFAVS